MSLKTIRPTLSAMSVLYSFQVEWQCAAHVWSKSGSDVADQATYEPVLPVQLTTIISAFCPSCQTFLNDQLLPTFYKLANIMDVRVVPAFFVSECFVRV